MVMKSIGETLKNARRAKELSLEEASKLTGISVVFLAALEDENYEVFRNKIYVRANMRDYSNFLELDSGELLENYEKSLEKSTAPLRDVVFFQKHGIAICICVVILIGLCYVFIVKKSTSQTPVAEEIALSEEVPLQAPPEPKKKAIPDKVILEIAAINDVWVDIRAYEGESFTGVLCSGEKKTFTSPMKVYIRIARPQAAIITLNGTEKHLGTTEPVTKVFLLENIIKNLKK